MVINSRQSVAKIMLMHAIGTTLAFWIYFVIDETVNAINLKRLKISDSKLAKFLGFFAIFI